VATSCAAGIRAFSPPCAGTEHIPSPPKTNTLATSAGDAPMTGPPIPSPIVEVLAQS
jgi:hypothetical protein